MARREKPTPPRLTLWDALELGVSRNVYCRLEDLTNEASVESFFISRMLKDLGYKDSQIKTKSSLSTFAVGLGSKRERYKPDYVLKVKGVPRCVIDAKGPDQPVEKWIEQCTGYCIALNRKYATSNPVRYFVLSNGVKTLVYEWDRDEPTISLDFHDFNWGNPKYEQLKKVLSASVVAASTPDLTISKAKDFTFTRPTSERARQLFAQCHRAIWKSEGYGPTPAFLAFVKVMFVKLWCDRRLRQEEATRQLLKEPKETITLPSTSVMFSVKWVEEREAEGTVNPVDAILFTRLRDELETKIALKEKKRLFDKTERIGLKPYTVKDVVRRLEHVDMFGIDEDLNGRLFETFLNATMRGRDLGQFFTPRSVVKMISRLADLKVTRDYQDKVIDGCCGSGGFLIEALTVMRNLVREHPSLALSEKEELLKTVSNDCIYGIDYGKDPPLSRIARINMYLHGDGGSRIYFADGLDKKLDAASEDHELTGDLTELQKYLADVRFDVALTNPPFSMTKEQKNESEKRILYQYDIAKKSETLITLRSGVLSSVLFLERYWDILREGGRLITVIDDSILASPLYNFARDFIRERYLIRAIISLPGDTFRRSGSRVKTSVLVLEKKSNLSDPQPGCFAFFAESIGVDDLTPRATETEVQQARAKAKAETDKLVDDYKAFMAGKKGQYLILPPERLTDRLDLKSAAPDLGRMVAKWKAQGIDVKPLSECVTYVENVVNPSDNPEEVFNLIKVTYTGECKVDGRKKGRDIRADAMHKVKAGQLVFSIMRATDGAVGIVPEDADGALATKTSYYLFECETPEDTAYLWAILRSHEIRADMQSISSGFGRYYTHWPGVGEKILIPWLQTKERRTIGRELMKAWELERKTQQQRDDALSKINELGVESPESVRRWKASKVPV